MPRQRVPTAVMVIAVLQLVFGCLGLLSVAFNLLAARPMAAVSQQQPGGPPGQQPINQAELQARIEKAIPNYQLTQAVSLVASSVLCLLMIASGLGLLRLAAWARYLAITYAVLSILVTVVNVVYSAVVVVPAMSRFSQELTQQGGQEAQFMAQLIQGIMIGAVVFSAVVVVYPVIVLIIMLLPSTRAAFRGVTLPAEPEDYRDTIPPGDLAAPGDQPPAGEV